jgi:hypothetical protein
VQPHPIFGTSQTFSRNQLDILIVGIVRVGLNQKHICACSLAKSFDSLSLSGKHTRKFFAVFGNKRAQHPVCVCERKIPGRAIGRNSIVLGRNWV